MERSGTLHPGLENLPILLSKKVHGEDNPRDFEEMRHAIDRAAEEAINKKQKVLEKNNGQKEKLKPKKNSGRRNPEKEKNRQEVLDTRSVRLFFLQAALPCLFL